MSKNIAHNYQKNSYPTSIEQLKVIINVDNFWKVYHPWKRGSDGWLGKNNWPQIEEELEQNCQDEYLLVEILSKKSNEMIILSLFKNKEDLMMFQLRYTPEIPIKTIIPPKII